MFTNRYYICQTIQRKEVDFYLAITDNVGWNVTIPIIRNIFQCNLDVGNSIDRFRPVTDSFHEYYF